MADLTTSGTTSGGASTSVEVEASPPPYTEVGNTSYNTIDASEPPPSYESLYGRVRAAKQESDGHVGFFKQLITIVASTIGCTIFLAILLAIPITMIVIGAVYKNDCPAEPFIPIYLIVAGVFGGLRSLSSLAQRAKNRHEDRDDDNVKTNPLDGLVGCFLFCWFIAGNVWIYRLHGNFQSDDPNAAMYCNFTLYWFSFWITTATYIIMGVTCCCVCCAGCLASFAD